MSAPGLTLQIDYREKDMYEVFKKSGVPDGITLEEPCNLDIGDIIIKTSGGDQVIIERKRFDDLASSIKDGRYDEQKMRCMAYIQQQRTAGGTCMLIYLLEGDLTYCRNNSDVNMALGAWISMELRDHVPVVRVLNMDEGVKWVCRLCERIKKKPDEILKGDGPKDRQVVSTDIKTVYLGGASGSIASESCVVNNTDSNIKQVTQGAYLGTIKTKKKENITPDTCSQVMLAVIPGMTSDTAKIVLDTLGNGTLVGLINSLAIGDGITGAERDTTIKEKKKVLASIQVKPGRKLGPTLADKLWDYLFAQK